MFFALRIRRRMSLTFAIVLVHRACAQTLRQSFLASFSEFLGVFVSWWWERRNRTLHEVSMILRLSTADENLLLERHFWARIPGVQS